MGFLWHYGHVAWINGSQPNFDDILKQLSLSIASRRLFSLTFMLRFIIFVIYTEKSLTLVVGTRAFLSQMCPFMFRFECMRLRGLRHGLSRDTSLWCLIHNISRFGSLVFQLTSEVWKRVMGHVVRKPDVHVTACKKQRRRPACASAQFDQCLCCSLSRNFSW